MCTSIVVNKKKTIVGWNLDILDMECSMLIYVLCMPHYIHIFREEFEVKVLVIPDVHRDEGPHPKQSAVYV